MQWTTPAFGISAATTPKALTILSYAHNSIKSP